MKRICFKLNEKTNVRKTAIIIVILLLLFVFCWYENKHLVVTGYEYCNQNIPNEFDGFRIVQISDLHNVKWGKNNNGLAEKISQCSPDIIVITGDIVDSEKSDFVQTTEFVRLLCDICPVYYVTGNHEYYFDNDLLEELISGFKDAGVTVLDNEYDIFEINNDRLAIIGVDDRYLIGDTLENLVKETSGIFNVVLVHEPQYLLQYSRAGANLVFAGHAHGGQFRIPFVGGLVSPDQGIFPKYTEGVHTEGNTTMVISRGLGNSVVPVRLFNDPEIVVVEFNNR